MRLAPYVDELGVYGRGILGAPFERVRQRVGHERDAAIHIVGDGRVRAFAMFQKVDPLLDPATEAWVGDHPRESQRWWGLAAVLLLRPVVL